jgi:hypothetical protein
MKTTIYRSLITIHFLAVTAASTFAQGSLTPPGTPAPTMKSLDQIEARTPISSAPFTISAPGSYYLTNNLAVTSGPAIIINNNVATPRDVTLDLNGFTISSTASNPNDTAIVLGAPINDITILNGHIQGYVSYNGSYSGIGFLHGINHIGTAIFNVRVIGVTVSGCLMDGINVGSNATVVENCTVGTVGGSGIVADVVSNSSVYQAGTGGIVATTVSNCHGAATQSGAHGISCSAAINSYGQATSGNGIDVTVATNCYGLSTSGKGVNAVSATGCYGLSTSGTGISATSVQYCYGEGAAGINASQTAIGCRGIGHSGIGVYAPIAAFCSGSGGSGYAGVYGPNAAFACNPNASTLAGHAYFCGSGSNPYP